MQDSAVGYQVTHTRPPTVLTLTDYFASPCKRLSGGSDTIQRRCATESDDRDQSCLWSRVIAHYKQRSDRSKPYLQVTVVVPYLCSACAFYNAFYNSIMILSRIFHSEVLGTGTAAPVLPVSSAQFLSPVALLLCLDTYTLFVLVTVSSFLLSIRVHRWSWDLPTVQLTQHIWW